MQSNNPNNANGKVQEDALDENFKQHVIMLQLLCSRHTNCTDLLLTRDWVRRFSRATKEERYARNYLMSMLCNQLTNGNLGRPFTDGRFLNSDNSLQDIMQSLFRYSNHLDQLHKEPDRLPFVFHNPSDAQGTLRQRGLSDNRSFDRRDNSEMRVLYRNYGQNYNRAHSHDHRDQSDNRVFISFRDPSLRKHSEYGRGNQNERSFHPRSESAYRPHCDCMPSYVRESDTRSSSVGAANVLYSRVPQSRVSQHTGPQYQYSRRGVAGGNPVVNNIYAYQDEMDRTLNDLHQLRREYGDLSNEYRLMHLEIDQLEAKMKRKSNRLTNDRCHNYGHNSTHSSKVPKGNNNCQQQSLHMGHSHFQGCHEDPDDGAYGGAPSYYNTNANINAKANTKTNVNVSNNTPNQALKKHMELLQKQLIKSAQNTIDQLNEITSLNRFETQQKLFLTQRTQDGKTENYRKTMTNCKHHLFSKSLAALSYNDKSFDEFLRKSDAQIDKLLNAIFECNSNLRKQFVEGELNKFWEIMSEEYKKEHKFNLKQHKKADKMHTGLNELRTLTILKMLFLKNCVGKLDHVDKVIKRLDEEFALIGKHL